MEVKQLKQKDVIVIGGGISGLTAVYQLYKQAPHLKLVLIEAEPRLGGKIYTEQRDGFVIEHGPDSVLARKPRGVGLCEDLGIASDLIGRNPNHQKTFVLRHGRLHRLPEGLTGMIPTNLEALANSTLLSENGRLQIAQEPNLPPASNDVGDESLASFVSRRFGQEAFENLIEPLMGGIYAGQATQLSLAATFPQLRQLEIKHGSLINGLTNRPPATDQLYPPFVSLSGGMGQLVEALVAELDEVDMLLGCKVTAVEKTDDGYRLDIENNNRSSNPKLSITQYQTQAIILATPAFISGKLIEKTDPTLANALLGIPYSSTALVNLIYDESDLPNQLDGYGYVIPNAEQKEALACTWSSLKWNGRAPNGKLLLRVYIGRFGTDVTQYCDEKLLAIAYQELSDTLNITQKPLEQTVKRWPKGMPQFNMGHLDRVQTIRSQMALHPNMALAGNYFDGVGIPDAIFAGEQAAEKIQQAISLERELAFG
ncbi:MAG: protoporphyrinogen oxidase [Chloroflexota bacterium]